MEQLTTISDTNELILMELYGDDLLNVCLTYKGIHKICINKNFWIKKFEYDDLPGNPSLNEYIKINKLVKKATIMLDDMPRSSDLSINLAVSDIKIILPISIDISNINIGKKQKEISVSIHKSRLFNETRTYNLSIGFYSVNANKQLAISILMRIMYYFPGINIESRTIY